MNIRLNFLVVFSTLVFSSYASASPDSATCLKVEGTFENIFDKDYRPCLIEVISNGFVTDTISLTRFKRKFRYYFGRNCCYSLRVSKAGFVPLVIVIDTKKVTKENVIYQFEFTTRLITEKRARTFNQQALDLPIAIIQYSDTRKNFFYDEQYTDSIKSQLVFKPALSEFQRTRRFAY